MYMQDDSTSWTPGCGKTTLLVTVAGKLDKISMYPLEIVYNCVKLQDLILVNTSAYTGQYDLYVPEMIV